MVATQEENQAQIISGGDEDIISLEELANTTGSTDSDAEALLGVTEDNSHPTRKEQPQDVTKNLVMKTLFKAGLLLVVVVLASLLWMVFGSGGKKETVGTPNQEEVTDENAVKIQELEEALYRERAQVAVRNLQSPLQDGDKGNTKSKVVGAEPIPQPQNLAQVQDGLTPGMQGILNQSPVGSQTPSYQEIRVPIGAIAEGKVIVPLHWNQEIDGTDGLFLVELTEPLMAEDGTPALAEGTQLIVSVSFVSDAGQVFQSVVAVVHPDGRQETIPATGEGYNGAPTTPLVIRGKQGEVLIAEKIEGSNARPGMGSDILVGLLDGIQEAADNITQPEQQTNTQTTGLSSTTQTQQNRQEPEAAFIKGLMETLTERMTARLDAEPEELKIFQVDRGEKVLLFVNGFVTFRVPTGRRI